MARSPRWAFAALGAVTPALIGAGALVGAAGSGGEPEHRALVADLAIGGDGAIVDVDAHFSRCLVGDRGVADEILPEREPGAAGGVVVDSPCGRIGMPSRTVEHVFRVGDEHEVATSAATRLPGWTAFGAGHRACAVEHLVAHLAAAPDDVTIDEVFDREQLTALAEDIDVACDVVLAR